MSRLSRRSMASVGGAVVLALFSLSMANAESTSDYTSLSYWAAEVFAKTLRDQTAISDQNEWSDFSALGYARSRRSDDAAVRWLPPPMPAVDGINGKIDGYGGGANHTNGFYGGTGSLSVPLAQQWGAQFDGGVGSDEGIGWLGGAGHLFWRDPSIGLLGAFGSDSHWNGIDIVNFGHISTDTGHFAAEGEYYWGRLPDLRWSRWRPNGAHQRARRTRRASRFHSQPLLRSDLRVLLCHRQFQALDWTSLPVRPSRTKVGCRAWLCARRRAHGILVCGGSFR